MAETQLLTWDDTGKRIYETGVDHGVLYVMDPDDGSYPEGVAWNGLVSVTESPSGAEATALYADNIKYLNIISAEEFGATIEAFTYPDEFMACDGSALDPDADGVMLGQQGRAVFGLCYRTKMGNDSAGQEFGYKLHLVYGLQAAPSERAYSTVNDSPEAITFSWELKSTPISAGEDYKPVSMITIDSTKADETCLAALEEILYGVTGGQATVKAILPLPAAVISTMTPVVGP